MSSQETILTLPGIRVGGRELGQVGAAVAFSAGYGFLESIVLEDFLKNIGNYQDPIIGDDIYPYHALIMTPLFLGVALVIGHDPRLRRNLFDLHAWFRTLLNVLQVFPPLVVMEDIFYFIFQYYDQRHPETYQKWNLTMDAWTCKHMGCQDAGFTAIPNWYILSAIAASGAWFADNIVFPERPLSVMVPVP